MIALLLPFLPVILAIIAALTGFGANAWLNFTDWQSAAIFATALVACVYVAQSDKPWARLAIVAIVGVALYLKGGVDKETALTVQHKAEINGVHSTYAAAAAAELARQAAANKMAAAAAETERQQFDFELADLRAKLAASAEAAAKDPRANAPALSLGAIKRLNAVRMRGRAGL